MIGAMPAYEDSTTLLDAPNSDAQLALRLQLVLLESSGLTICTLPDTGSVNIGRGEDCELRILARRTLVRRLVQLGLPRPRRTD